MKVRIRFGKGPKIRRNRKSAGQVLAYGFNAMARRAGLKKEATPYVHDKFDGLMNAIEAAEYNVDKRSALVDDLQLTLAKTENVDPHRRAEILTFGAYWSVTADQQSAFVYAFSRFVENASQNDRFVMMDILTNPVFKELVADEAGQFEAIERKIVNAEIDPKPQPGRSLAWRLSHPFSHGRPRHP